MPTKQRELPIRVVVGDKSFPFYQWIGVKLDNVVQPYCTTADRTSGYVIRYKYPLKIDEKTMEAEKEQVSGTVDLFWLPETPKEFLAQSAPDPKAKKPVEYFS